MTSRISRLSKKRSRNKGRKSKRRDIDYGSTFTGGLVNPISGAGTSLDKNSSSFFLPTRQTSRGIHEVIYAQSWAAAKFIDIPVDDMFVKWREFCDMENDNVKLIEQAEKDFKIKSKLSKTLKNSRLHGTGLFVILTKDATPEKPLNIDRMQPGDLSNILIVDRFDATIGEKEKNPYSQNFGMPIFYRIQLKQGGTLTVHHSRVIRFDGIKPLSDNRWQSYDPDWGVASIIPVLTEIFQDSNVSKGVAHLVNEASIKNMKIEGFEDAIAGGGDGEMSLQDRMLYVSSLMSIYRTNFMDSEDDFSRTEVSFSGLHEIIDRNALRLAAAANIPETRFWGKSVVGLTATGEGDARNYALKVQSDQENQLPEPLDIIDKVLAKHTGITEPVCYKFISILDLSEKDKVENALKKSQTVVPLITAGIIDEDEGRKVLDGDEILGDFDDLAGPLPGVDDTQRNLAAVQVQQQQKDKAWKGDFAWNQ